MIFGDFQLSRVYSIIWDRLESVLGTLAEEGALSKSVDSSLLLSTNTLLFITPVTYSYNRDWN